MNLLVRSLVDEFLAAQGTINDGRDFEQFVSYSIISREYGRIFDLDSIIVGDGNDTGIDALAIIVNGYLVEEEDEINDLLSKNGYLNIKYIFIQAKSSEAFDASEINNFIFGVKDFFKETPALICNDDISRKRQLSQYLFRHASRFEPNPICSLFYVSTGRFTNDLQDHTAVMEQGKNDLLSLDFFSSVNAKILGASEISECYKKSKRALSTTIYFSNKVTLPTITDVQVAYIGILPLSEFSKLITEDSVDIANVFEDNVRDFQSLNNTVNLSISTTLDGDGYSLFPLLNNGVTIVASSIKATGDNLTIFDYQIVNGCQTSNVLFQHLKKEELTGLSVPIKLIITEDEGIKNNITVATNSQTPIKREQLTALTDLQRQLEQFYKASKKIEELYYERRSRQYDNASPSIPQSRIITISNQIKSFSAMYYKNPHRVTSYFGSLTKNIGTDKSDIFNIRHRLLPYYVAGFTYFRLESCFRNGTIDRKYKKVRYFLLMLFKLLLQPQEVNSTILNSDKRAEKYCAPMIDVLKNNDECVKTFIAATEVIEKSKVDFNDKDIIKQATTTEKIINMLHGV